MYQSFSSLLGSSNCMGVMREDVKGLEDDARNLGEWCRFVKMERMYSMYFLRYF